MMIEVQHHGLSFERWVCDRFFDGYQGEYGSEWDVVAEKNSSKAIPEASRNIPVSIKTAKIGSSINLGDALRQYRVIEPFLMIVGFWEQRTGKEKWFREIGIAKFDKDAWRALWGDLMLVELQEFDNIIKDLKKDHEVVRQEAKAWKRNNPKVQLAPMTLNPKIDSKKQRRLQCSLKYIDFWRSVGREASLKGNPMLWDVKFPNPVLSSSRTFKQT